MHECRVACFFDSPCMSMFYFIYCGSLDVSTYTVNHKNVALHLPNSAVALESSAIVMVCRLSSSVTRVYCDKTTASRITRFSLKRR